MNINEQLKMQAMYSAGAFAKPAPSLDLTPEGVDAMDKDALDNSLEPVADVDEKPKRGRPRKGAATLAGELKAVVLI